MAGLRRVFDHPCLLVHDSSLCRAVAGAASFLPTITLYGAAARVDGHVGCGRAGHAAVAEHLALSHRLAVGRGGSAFRRWILCLFAIRKEFQREAARRAAGSSWHEPRAATGHGWHPFAGTASGVPGACVRNAGMERGNRTRGVLGTDGVRNNHGSGDDPDGGCGVGAEVWRLLSNLSQLCASSSAPSVRAAPAIIRSD